MPTTIDIPAAFKGAIMGGVAAGLLDVGLYFAAGAFGADFAFKHPENMGGLPELLFFQPMVNCVMAALAATAVLWGLTKFAGENAWPAFLAVSTVVFVGMGFASVWALNDPTAIATLEIMHIPATIGIVGGMYRMGVRRS